MLPFDFGGWGLPSPALFSCLLPYEGILLSQIIWKLHFLLSCVYTFIYVYAHINIYIRDVYFRNILKILKNTMKQNNVSLIIELTLLTHRMLSYFKKIATAFIKLTYTHYKELKQCSIKV